MTSAPQGGAAERPDIRHSVLFPPWEPAPPEAGEAPGFFADLNFDAIVADVTASSRDYRLDPFFWTPLERLDSVEYRQQAMGDLADDALRTGITRFSALMRDIRKRLEVTAERRPRQELQAWGLEAADRYCLGVLRLCELLRSRGVESLAFTTLARHLDAYTRSPGFLALVEEVGSVQHQLDTVRYTLRIEGQKVTVSRYQGQTDYSEEVLETFERFRRGDVRDAVDAPKPTATLNHVEARVLELVAALFPQQFDQLAAFWEEHHDFVDPTIARFDREVQFYLSYLDYTRRFAPLGLSFNYPSIDREADTIFARETFDLALAGKLLSAGRPVVANDFELRLPERIIVITGPNQGGKTTLARAVGQLHHLARLGLPVPGVEAQLALCDSIFTHFEHEEDIQTLTGKLESDLIRIHAILGQASAKSLIVMNESFSSTSLEDARVLGANMLTRIIEIGAMCVYVTFVDELSRLAPATVSMVSTVEEHDPAVRTFRVVRRRADGAAYALAISEKYGLTYARLKERIQ